MIKLTLINQDKTLNISWINPAYISTVTPLQEGSLISIQGCPAVLVQEDAANIVAMLRGSK
jgi:hypothetical protein